jgi:hypothetical protein
MPEITFKTKIYRHGKKTPTILSNYTWEETMEALADYQSSVDYPLVRVAITRIPALAEEVSNA